MSPLVRVSLSAQDWYPRPYLTQSVLPVGLQKSIPAQIRQLILYIGNSKG